MLNRNLTSDNERLNLSYVKSSGKRFNENYTMVYTLKKLFKKNDIPYLWQRKRPDMIVVNSEVFPRLVFMEGNNDYVNVRRIPWDEWEYSFQANSLPVLLRKLLTHRLITFNQIKKLDLPNRIDKHVLKAP